MGGIATTPTVGCPCDQPRVPVVHALGRHVAARTNTEQRTQYQAREVLAAGRALARNLDARKYRCKHPSRINTVTWSLYAQLNTGYSRKHDFYHKTSIPVAVAAAAHLPRGELASDGGLEPQLHLQPGAAPPPPGEASLESAPLLRAPRTLGFAA